MKNTLVFVLFIHLVFGCVDIAGGTGGVGGGAGGGGGTGSGFTKGFVFVRRDDRNVYVANPSNYQTPVAVTSLGSASTPSLSHDGKTIVFVRVAGNDSAILTVPSAGGDETTVLVASAMPGISNLRTPVFTPDGLHLVFSYDSGGASGIGGVDTTGANAVLLAGGSALSYSGASVYPDGSAVLAAAGTTVDQLNQLARIDLTTLAVTSVTQTLGLDAFNVTGRTVVAPDGLHAAFEARISSGSTRVFVVDLSTTAISQLTDYPSEPGANDSAPCWLGNDTVCFSSDTGGADAAYALSDTLLRTSGGLQVPTAIDPWYGPN